jgi:biotin operon repressor
MSEPTVQQQIVDRKAQREKLRAYFEANPDAYWTQETLAESCGADVGAVRTRISELRAEGMNLVDTQPSFRTKDGILHRGKKLWSYVVRPAHPLGPDAAEPRERLLFDTHPRG